MKRRCVLFLFILSASMANSQPVNLDRLFSWSIESSSLTIEAGGKESLHATLFVAPSHIVYRKMTSLTLEGPQGLRAGEAVFPPAETKTDPIDGTQKEIYEGKNAFTIPFSIDSSAPGGVMDATVTVKYQGCSKQMCFFPQTRHFPVKIQVGTGNTPSGTSSESSTPATPAITKLTTNTPDSPDFFERGYLLTFLFVYAMGILTSFTPCVYPLIPITVTIFGAKKSKSTFHAFLLASTYVLGIAVMYSSLGYAAAATGAVFGQFMSNPWVMSLIAIFFVAMAVSMLGAFELQLPSTWQARLTQVGGEGYLPAFFMGLIAGIIAAPCTGPVLAGILAYVATTGNPAIGILLLLIYSLGLGTLFLIIGTYSGMIQRLPRSGKWMDSVKSIFAIVLFTCALYFLKNAFPVLNFNLPRTGTLIVVSLLIFLSGLGAGALYLSIHAPNLSTRLRKMFGLALCTAAFYLPLSSQPPMGKGQVNWRIDLDAALAQAQEEHKPVLIDFGAEWCAVCKEIDHSTFHDEQAAQKLNERFIAIKVDLTRDNTVEAQKLIQRYDITGLPLLVFYDSQGNELPDQQIRQFINPENFVKHLQGIQ